MMKLSQYVHKHNNRNNHSVDFWMRCSFLMLISFKVGPYKNMAAFLKGRLIAALSVSCLMMSVNGAWAQNPEIPQPLPVKMQDENGVDVVSGYVNFAVTDVGIGSLQNEILGVRNANSTIFTTYNGVNNGGFERTLRTPYWGGGLLYTVSYSNTFDSRSRMVIEVADISETFFINGDWSYESYTGGKLTPGNCTTVSSLTYTSKDGVQVFLDCTLSVGYMVTATKITYPDGRVVDINYGSYFDGQYTRRRIQSVTASDGSMIKYNYEAPLSEGGSSFYNLVSVVGINRAYDYCDPLADSCTLNHAWPRSQYEWSNGDLTLSITSQSGSITRFTMDEYRRVIAVKPSNSSIDRIFYNYCGRVTPSGCSSYVFGGPGGSTPPTLQVTEIKDRVISVVSSGQTWDYSFPQGNYGLYYLPYKSSGPEGRQSYALSTILGSGALLTYNRTGPNAVYANFENSPRNRLLNARIFGRQTETYEYDARGNLLSNGFVTAGFEATCTNQIICNRPQWVRDRAGNQTDYSYSPVHGGPVTVTGPAVQGVRPQTRYEYIQRTPWLRSSTGGYVAGLPIWLLSATSSCRTSAASGNPSAPCAVAGDEVRIEFEYGPDNGPNNLLQRGTVTMADGQVSRTCFGYDHRFQKISETQPMGTGGACP
jgi:hypothetical protein